MFLILFSRIDPPTCEIFLTLSNNVFIIRNSFIINDLGAGASRRAVTR